MTSQFALRKRTRTAVLFAHSFGVALFCLSTCAAPGYPQRAPRKGALNSALLRAAAKNHAAEVKSLLARGANPNATGPLGYTPIMLLALHPKCEASAIQALQKKGLR